MRRDLSKKGAIQQACGVSTTAQPEVYGDNRSLRVWLEQRDLHFVLAVRCNEHVWPDN